MKKKRVNINYLLNDSSIEIATSNNDLSYVTDLGELKNYKINSQNFKSDI